MTVAELIEELKNLPQDAHVCGDNDRALCSVSSISCVEFRKDQWVDDRDGYGEDGLRKMDFVLIT